MNDLNRNVILFGAGAVIDWGGPKTICNKEELEMLPEMGSNKIKNRVCCLTHLIESTGFETKSGIKITKKISNVLKDLNFSKNQVNFETIINVIEELINYYSNFSINTDCSILSSFLNPNEFLYDILNFEKNGNEIKIPNRPEEHIEYNLTKKAEQYFLERIMVNILDGIIGHVSKYSFFTSGHQSVVENGINEVNNQAFYKWIKSLIDKNGIVRMYTLNYDRLFKVILENKGIEIFEGFGSKADKFLPDIERILSDQDSSTYYNLHGSAYWELQTRNIYDLPILQFNLTKTPNLSYNQDELAIRQLDKGKNSLITNIIAGYQKTARLSISPFKQIHSAYDKACILADNIYIIGYGFGDEHINESVKTALLSNESLKIKIIDPGFLKYNLEDKFFAQILPNNRIQEQKKESENFISYFEGKIEVHTLSFADYINNFD